MKTKLILATLLFSPLAKASPVYNFNFYNGASKSSKNFEVKQSRPVESPKTVIENETNKEIQPKDLPENVTNQVSNIEKLASLIQKNNFHKSRLGVQYGNNLMKESDLNYNWNSEGHIGLLYSVAAENNYRHIWNFDYASLWKNDYLNNGDFNYTDPKEGQILNEEIDGTLSGGGLNYSLAKYFPIRNGLFSHFILAGGVGLRYLAGSISTRQNIVRKVITDEWGNKDHMEDIKNDYVEMSYFGARANLRVGLELNLGLIKFTGFYGQTYSRNFVDESRLSDTIPTSTIGESVALQLEVEI
jgi:hypothetical protein